MIAISSAIAIGPVHLAVVVAAPESPALFI
jgi:hypothetical protein